jgi:hypothetical protein
MHPLWRRRRKTLERGFFSLRRKYLRVNLSTFYVFDREREMRRDIMVAAAEAAAAEVMGEVAEAAAAEGTLAVAWAAAVQFMAAAAEGTPEAAGAAAVDEVAEVAAAVAWASAWAWGLEAAAGAVGATEAAGNGTRSCSTGSTSASDSGDL